MQFKELEDVLKELRVEYKKEEVLADYTTIKIGGPCKVMIFPTGISEIVKILKFLEEKGMKYFILGGGSNLLVGDEGFDGVVVNLKKFKGIETFEEKKEVVLRIKAGTKINKLISLSLRNGFSGLEFLAGVPATIGGAIKMNAGAFGKSISSLVKSVTLYREGKVLNIKPDEGMWKYRAFKEKGVVLEAEIKLQKTKKEEVKAEVLKCIQKRKETQPFLKKTFGSVFKNPPCYYAGKLIEACGLKGYRIGAAQISKKHANFIINLGGAKAKEVLELMRLARDKVFSKFKVRLEPEVKFLGCRL